MNANDYDFIQRCLQGDREAFRPLVESYQNLVFRTIVRMVYDPELAKDLTQEVFVKAYMKLDTFDPKYPFRVWINRIAIHRAIDYLRKKRNEYLVLDEPIATDEGEIFREYPDDKPDVMEIMEKHETAAAVRKAVHSLEPKLRAVVVLRHFQEMNYDEIASTLKIPVGTVKNRIFRGREKLQEILLAGMHLQGKVQHEM